MAADWFDGIVLAHYLVATAHFVHPISRRELSRDECVALDAYCVEHRLGSAHVTSVFDWFVFALNVPGAQSTCSARSFRPSTLRRKRRCC